MSKGTEEAPPVEEKPIVKDFGTQYIVQKSILIKDPSTGQKAVTITVTNEILPFLFEGLGKYIESRTSDLSEQDTKERNQAYQLVDELNTIKSILNEEVIKTTKGTQEPNATEQTVGIPEEEL